MASFLYKDFEIHYSNEGDGQPILFLHGLGGSSINWLYQRSQFKKNFQVIAIDLPGHGKSEGADVLSFHDYRKVVHALAEELKLQDIIVCGISMGGKVALDYACYHADRVSGLLLADTFAGVDEEEKRRRKAVWDLMHEPNNGVDRWITRVIDEMGLDPNGPIAKGFHKGILNNQLEFMYKLFAQLIEYDQREWLPEIKAPAVVIHGERDRFIPFSCAEDIQQGLVHAELHIINDCGHLPNVEQPKKYNEYLEHLIQKI